MKFGRCSTDTWSLGSPTKREIDPTADKVWQLNQCNETNIQKLEHDWDVLMALAMERGLSKKKMNIQGLG